MYQQHPYYQGQVPVATVAASVPAPPTFHHRSNSSFGFMQQQQQPNHYSTPPSGYFSSGSIPAPLGLKHSRSFYNTNNTQQQPTQIQPVQAYNGFIAPTMGHMVMPIAPPNVIAPPQPQGIQPAPPADEQVNGGINSVLEYDLNTMACFLSWCSFGMLKQRRNPTKEFESLIVSVLFATRLPKSTIIIALEYMNQRFSSHSDLSLGGSGKKLTEQEIFVNLIVSLILANKFNDDNTFTNKSWCGATGLQLQVLNKEEKDWLDECKWSLNVVNFESNIITLEECWTTWLDKYGNNQDAIETPAVPSTTLAPSKINNIISSSPASIHQQYYHPHHQYNSSLSSKMSNSYSSIPSSPIYSDTYYYPSSSSPSITPPTKYNEGSLWADNFAPTTHSIVSQQQGPTSSTIIAPSGSIWTTNANNNNTTTPNISFQPHGHPPAIPFLNTSTTSYPFHHHPLIHHGGGFVGYANPYYMASC
ncbi:cyclin-like protein [Scheffersomyces amazonensis]|uniref:cyclin-like protein n=1 Tax=Scheffersomyces amazonensis TaxID=1078765 RepID=UPI00315C7D21